MIKLKLGELQAVAQPLANVMSVKLPIKIAYRLSRLHAKAMSELRHFTEAQNRLIKELGEASPEDANRIEIKKPEALAEYAKRLGELLEEEVTIDRDPVKIDDFGDAQLAPADLAALEKFIVGDEA